MNYVCIVPSISFRPFQSFLLTFPSSLLAFFATIPSLESFSRQYVGISQRKLVPMRVG